MRVVLFLLCLCSVLLNGELSVHGAARLSSSAYAAAEHFGGHEQNAIAAGNPYRFLAENAHASDFKDDVIEDNFEDEEVDGLSALPTNRFCPAQSDAGYLSFSSLLKHSSNCFASPKPSFAPVSDRYLLQGVLRI